MTYHKIAMDYNYNEDYQYDSCISRGLCSINPRTSSLQEVLLLYLKLAAYYTLKLYENGYADEDARNIILNTISVMVSNFEFSENDFETITAKFNKILPDLIEKYKTLCKEKNLEPDFMKSNLKFNQVADIVKSIQFGEKEFLNKLKNLSSELRDLYKISFVLAKSVCINILDLETFGINAEEGYLSVLKLLNNLNANNQDVEKIKKMIEDIATVDNGLMNSLKTVREERYGKAGVVEVSYTTTPGKAVLVVGSNIRELEDILEALKDEDIDVYTHDEMMLAHTYSNFRKYKHLKGQFGQGIENCLLDFATFPGPIILTRHSLYNVENLYRGLLFTTDFATSKGVISIKDKDFSEVIKSAQNARGFKRGKQCESVNVGFDYDLLMDEVKKRTYSRIFVIGLGAYTLDQKAYFEKLLSQTPEDVLVISLSYCIQRDNIICLNACFDSYAITGITNKLIEEVQVPITLFFPKCDRHTISQMIYLAGNKNVGIYVGRCAPIMLNPNMMITLQKIFGIKGLTSVKKNLAEIIG